MRTRFPPSPTGGLHIGNARTALFNYLLAKKSGGTFVLRIEDTDRERSEKKFEEDIFNSLEWLGIRADEGPREGGPYRPYRQSERTYAYRPYLEKLLRDGLSFYCYHTAEELDAEKKTLMAAGKNPVHQCTYRETKAEPKPEGLESLIRFKAPVGRKIVFNDLIRGEISFESELLGDFSIAKNLDEPLYNFAVVIDDAEMKISHVIRGEDHISNTPKQILIQEALGLATPKYGHLPIILGPDRAKLSKRHGATAVSDFRRDGYLAEALINFMALLGWNPGSDRTTPEKGEPRPKEREIFSMDELVEEFDLAKVQKSGAVFNIEKLDWMNGEYIRRKSPPELTALAAPFLADFLKFPVPNNQFLQGYVENVIALEQPRMKKLSEIGERAEYFFREPEYLPELLKWKEMSADDLRSSIEKSKKIISEIKWPARPEEVEKEFTAAIGAGDKGAILWPLRAALTGKKASAGPFEIAAILGKEESLKRLETALQKISQN